MFPTLTSTGSWTRSHSPCIASIPTGHTVMHKINAEIGGVLVNPIGTIGLLCHDRGTTFFSTYWHSTGSTTNHKVSFLLSAVCWRLFYSTVQYILHVLAKYRDGYSCFSKIQLSFCLALHGWYCKSSLQC